MLKRTRGVTVKYVESKPRGWILIEDFIRESSVSSANLEKFEREYLFV